jgi:outer membrane protein
MKNKIFYGYLVLSLGLIGILFFLRSKENKKIGYVTTLKVFEEFALKKELEGDYKKMQIIRQTYLDSIKLNVQTLSVLEGKDLNREEKIDRLKKAYLLKENQFNQENENLYSQYNEQIWNQLNQYVQDFGKEQGYDYLLGASGQGSIMYAKENEDVTKEVIEYVNNKYRGKKNK